MFKTIKRFAATTISLALVSVMFLSLPASAQNLAEAARQERERRKTLPPTHHVYTNEDLAKARILVPEDQARVEAHNTNQSSPVLVVAIDASRPSAPLPIPGITLASQAPIMLRGPVTEPAPPNSIYTVAASFDVTATSPAQLMFPDAETSVSKVPERRPGTEPQAPSILSRVENAQIEAPGLLAVPMAFPAAHASVPKVPERRAGAEPQVPSILSRVETAQIEAPYLLAVPMVFPDGETSAPKVPDRRAAREPQAPFILSRTENAQIGATAPAVYIPFPAFLAVPTAVPNEPLAAEHSSATPPAIRSANCVGPCSELHGLELNGILSTQYAVPDSRPVAETASIQPAIIAKSESIKPRPAPANWTATQVRVQIGDSLWKLAKRYLGNGNHWRELAALNRRLPNPGLIRPGELIQLPARVSEEARQVVVQRGDTLWAVAETALGSPLAFNCIAHANPQLQSANVIHPGQTLLVPETCLAARQLAAKDHAGAL